MKQQMLICMIFTAVLTVMGHPVSAGPGDFDPKAGKCAFSKWTKAFVRNDKGSPKINTFLVADSFPHADGEYWIHWPQKQALLLISWPAKTCASPATLVIKRIDLKTNLVKTEGNIKGSTHYLAEVDAEKILLSAALSSVQISF